MQQQTDTSNAETSEKGGRSKLFIFLPLILFTVLAAVFIYNLKFGKGGRYIPSNLIGKVVPDFQLVKMEGVNGSSGQPMRNFGAADLKRGGVSIVNVWSSWCVSCRYEHKFLEKLAHKAKAPLYGLNYKDTAGAGRDFLKRFGNPYTAIGMDPKGRVGIDFGVYGVPETFIVDGKGVIRYKLPGPVSDRIIEKELLPAIEKARAQS